MDRQDSITLKDITNFLLEGALLRRRGEWLLIEGPFVPIECVNNAGISVFCPDFYATNLRSEPLWAGSRSHNLTNEQLRILLQKFLSNQNHHESELDFRWEEPQKKDFAESLSVIQQKISRGQIQKAVPVVFERGHRSVSSVDRAHMILQLLAAPETLHAYGFWREGQGVLGATPEVLFEYRDYQLKTMALAGTCPKSESALRESLLTDAKELKEHNLVVQDLQELLAAYGEVVSQGPFVLELPSLYHLKTDIGVSCEKQPDFLDLISILHPTPALGVAPRSAGYHWMSELPGQDQRGPFGGPVAFLSQQEALCLVGIRNLQWNREISMIGSGCGVVAASELEREWRELFQKRLSVKKILGL